MLERIFFEKRRYRKRVVPCACIGVFYLSIIVGGESPGQLVEGLERVGACALKVFCDVCFGELVVGVYFGVGYGVPVTRLVLINIHTVLMTGPSYVTGNIPL